MRIPPIVGLGVVGAAAAAAYSYFARNQRPPQHAAFADDEAGRNDPTATRNAGPEAMRSDPDAWDRVDETSDESFPNSDPPGRY